MFYHQRVLAKCFPSCSAIHSFNFSTVHPGRAANALSETCLNPQPLSNGILTSAFGQWAVLTGLHPLCRTLVSPFRLDDVYLNYAQRTPCSGCTLVTGPATIASLNCLSSKECIHAVVSQSPSSSTARAQMSAAATSFRRKL